MWCTWVETVDGSELRLQDFDTLRAAQAAGDAIARDEEYRHRLARVVVYDDSGAKEWELRRRPN